MIIKITKLEVIHCKSTTFNSCFNAIHIFNLQKIEAFWSQLSGHSDMKQYKKVLAELENDGFFVRKNEMDR